MTNVSDEERITFLKNFKNVMRLCNDDKDLDQIIYKIKLLEIKPVNEDIDNYMKVFKDLYTTHKEKILSETYDDVNFKVDDKEIDINSVLSKCTNNNKKQLRARLVRCICSSHTGEIDDDLKKLSSKFVSVSNDKILQDVGGTISEGLMKMSSFRDLDKTGADGKEAFSKALKEVGNLTEDEKFMNNIGKVFDKATAGDITLNDISSQLIKEVYKLHNHSKNLNGKQAKITSKKIKKMMSK